ncbi:DUF3794 domain-containing protein [uncultured Ruminococcus sp.]|uniref:DUF3794 domain-containing protein n=1 Tax=uncultured Ruminococcus sp. TaxID=165186 RepID=UPI0025D9B951|nr:DUF3794 domain-containing protein [uncultured Ruminococcus sp.]
MNDEFKTSADTVCISEKVLDTTEELPLERDIVLPDYFPDVFRVLRCTVSPSADTQTVSGDKLTYGVRAVIRVLYLTEGSRRINCIEQETVLTRTAELSGDCPDPEVYTDLSCRGVTCRVKGSRRMDVRATVCAAVKVCCRKEKEILTSGSGCGIQLRRQTVTCPVKRLTASKRVTVIQQTALPDGKPPVGTVLRTGCTVTRSEQRIVAGKLAVKGDAELEVLYSCVDKAGEDTVQTLRFDLPFSQIIDMEGVDDSFDVTARVTPAGCTLIAGSGSENTAEWEAALNVFCTAEKQGTVTGVTDVFSTEYECTAESTVTVNAGRQESVSVTAAAEHTLSAPDGTVGSIYDCCGECTRPAVRKEEGKYLFTGSAELSVLGEGSEGGIFCVSGVCVYEAALNVPDGCTVSDARAEVTGCSYYLGEGGSIKVRAEIRISCVQSAGGEVDLISAVKLDRSAPAVRSGNCAVRLCRCGSDEDIWDIAKRFRTSVEALTEDNELTGGSDSPNGRLILIQNP